jgi:D-serine deaminase-like pyridoxal phosphate-dependent protein
LRSHQTRLFVAGVEPETPVGVVELAVAEANATRVASYCRQHGLRWRPHIKTHKSAAIAGLQLEAGATGLTVATPREAEVMSRVTSDILVAYPPVGEHKLSRLMSLPSETDLKIALDSRETLESLASASVEAGRVTGVLVEADVGARRVGLATDADLVALAEIAASLPGVAFRGLVFYPGHIRGPAHEQGPALRELNDRLDGLLHELEMVGLSPEIVSGGSTPTLWHSHEISGLTEVRSGTAIYNDREQLLLGTARPTDLAYTVLSTVISTSVPNQAVVDAGSKALAAEPRGVEGYGFLIDRPQVTLRTLSEEHGMLDLSSTDWRPSIGDRVRIVPNHVCVSVNLQDRIVVLDGDGEAEWWPLEGRGRGPWIEDGMPVAQGGVGRLGEHAGRGP